MRVEYFPDTDTLSIELRSGEYSNTEELNDDVTVDRDASGAILSVAIENARTNVDLSKIDALNLPNPRQ